MLLMLSLLSTVVLLVLHEYVAMKDTAGPSTLVHVRRFLLLLLVLSAIVFGRNPRVSAEIDAGLEAWRARPLRLDSSGDPFLTRALEDQRPERPFPTGRSQQETEAWQQYVVKALRARIGLDDDLSQTVPVEVLRTEHIEGVRRTLIRFTSWDGTRIPAYVHEPERGNDLAGIVVVPGHGAGIRGTAGIIANDYQHAAALQLAQQGYTTLTPELRGFGALTPDGVPNHRAVAHAALSAGSFYKAIVIRDLSRALTVLQRWDRVNATRVAVAGTSLGAELAVLLGAVDGRPRAIISASYGGQSGPSDIAEWVNDESGQTPHGCHTIPGINRLVWEEDWFRLLAPRAVLIVRGTRNVPRRLEEFKAVISDVFMNFGASDRFQVAFEEGGHEFFVAPAVQFLARWL